MAHVCEPKRRHQQKDEKHVQIAYIAYKRFYELTQGSSNFKTYEHFAQSQYYNAFVKFAMAALTAPPIIKSGSGVRANVPTTFTTVPRFF